jgi:hypothetical protein
MLGLSDGEVLNNVPVAQVKQNQTRGCGRAGRGRGEGGHLLGKLFDEFVCSSLFFVCNVKTSQHPIIFFPAARMGESRRRLSWRL